MNPKENFLNSLMGIKGGLQYNSIPATVQPPPAPVVKPVDVLKAREAIAHNESGILKKPYVFSQPSGQANIGSALGRYQVTSAELKSYAKRFLGQPINDKQFLASSTAQDKYMEGKIKYYSGLGYTPENIADIHRRGFTKSGDPGYTTYQDPDYVKKFQARYNATGTPSARR